MTTRDIHPFCPLMRLHSSLLVVPPLSLSYFNYMKDKIRPIYFELQGYLSQAPTRESGLIFEDRVWNQHNQTVDELEEISSKKYTRYRINPNVINWNGVNRPCITSQVYRTILGGLISRLHGEYFPDETSPINK